MNANMDEYNLPQPVRGLRTHQSLQGCPCNFKFINSNATENEYLSKLLIYEHDLKKGGKEITAQNGIQLQYEKDQNVLKQHQE